jgi:transcriptional regulator with GAF, ATPase, and Fis domain
MEENKYFIRDLKSTNGTFVKGKLISSGIEFEVKEGVAISIGRSVLCLGKALSDDVMAFLDSIDLFRGLDEDALHYIQDRPKTTKKNMELIYKVSNVLSPSLAINEILDQILDFIFDLLKRIDRGVVILIESETGKISEIIRSLKKRGDDIPTNYSQTVIKRVMQKGTPVIISDTYTEDEIEFAEALKLMKIRSVMCVPLISKVQIRGAIYIDSINKPHGFRKEDLSLFTALSSTAALAIENTFLYSRKNKGIQK